MHGWQMSSGFGLCDVVKPLTTPLQKIRTHPPIGILLAKCVWSVPILRTATGFHLEGELFFIAVALGLLSVVVHYCALPYIVRCVALEQAFVLE